jgi:hypothetical protein
MSDTTTEAPPPAIAPEPDHTPDDKAPPVAPVIVLEPPPPVALTPKEIGRLAELRATPNLTEPEREEMAALAARQFVPRPPDPPSRDKVGPLLLEVVGRMVPVLAGIVGSIPQLGGMQASMAGLTRAANELHFNASPPVDVPPEHKPAP